MSCQIVVYRKFGNPGSYCNCCCCLFCFVLVCLFLCFLQEIDLKIDVKGIEKDHAKNKDEVNDTRSVEQNPVTKLKRA